MNPNYIMITIVLAFIGLGAWLFRRGDKQLGAKHIANFRVAQENPLTAALIGDLFPSRSRWFDEGTMIFGMYFIGLAAYVTLSVMFSERALWMLVFGALAFGGIGIVITAPNKEGRQIGFMLTAVGVATVVATMLDIFPPRF